MKITDVKTFVVGNPPPHFGGNFFVFVKLTTDTGIEGIGEVYAAAFSPHVVAAMTEDIAAALGHRARAVPHREPCGATCTAVATACARKSRCWR